MSYQHFATVYDQLMNDVPYHEWVNFVNATVEKYSDHHCKKLLELATGTGTLALLLSDEGYDVQGTDLSDEMLVVAQDKMLKSNKTIPLFQQDMRELQGFKEQDMVVCFCDSLNYLTDENEVKQTFQHVYNALRPGGLFLFDVHSEYKINHIFGNHTFALNHDQVSYIWNCYHNQKDSSVEHELSFFVKQRNGQYERFDEFHTQKTFPIEKYNQLLNESGLNILDVVADFTFGEPTIRSERIFFITQKG